MSGPWRSPAGGAPGAKGTIGSRWKQRVALHETYELAEGPEWGAGEERLNSIVFIGRNLDQASLQQGLSACRADA